MAGKRHVMGSHTTPTRKRDKLFCERWLEHFDNQRAYIEAGFQADRSEKIAYYSARKVNRFMEYLRPLQEAKAREVAKAIVVNQEDILKAMVRKAVFDPGDYVEVDPNPMLETVGKGKNKTTRVRTWNGRPVHAERMKPFHKLTPEQRLTVEITEFIGDQVQYRLPTHREQHAAQVALGRQFGMFLDKLIIERHQARGAHNTLALDDVPTHELQQITLRLLPYVGQDFASRLGFTLEDIEDAKKRIVAEVPMRPN
jgi:hypothetical protein